MSFILFPKKWIEERIDGTVVYHHADWDSDEAEVRTQDEATDQLRGYLIGGFNTPPEAVRFLAVLRPGSS